MESGRENAEVNGAVKESPAALVTAVSAALKAEEGATNIRDDPQQLDDEENDMGKQNGDEELDESAQERMLKDESAAKITQNEKNTTEVRKVFDRENANSPPLPPSLGPSRLSVSRMPTSRRRLYPRSSRKHG